MKKIFQFSALAIAVSLSAMAVHADQNLSDPNDVNINIDTDFNNDGDFSVYSGAAFLINSNIISGTSFYTNVGIGGALTVSSPAGISTAKITLNGQDLETRIANADAILNTRINNEETIRTAADAALDTRVDNETAARATADTTLQNNINAEAATRAAAITAEANARTAGDAATLSSAKGYTDTKTAATLVAANAYTDGRANQLNSRIDDVQKTAYRGIAISLAAQQAVPSIQPGQVALFGGVGHYEGETAGSIGVVTSFTDRLSASGAFGFAGGNEFGGRVGVAYVFGGK